MTSAALSIADSLLLGAAAIIVSTLPHPVEHLETWIDVMSKSLEFFTRAGGAALVIAGWWRFHHPRPRGKRRKRPHWMLRALRPVAERVLKALKE